MCRNITTLRGLQPAATPEEIEAAARQYVRKVSGAVKPSKANQARFDHAVEAVAQATRELLDGMETQAPARSREVEMARAKARSAKRFGRAPVAG